MINVTKTFLPSFDEYTSILKRAWDKGWLTNNGELVQELEQRLKEYLGVEHLFFTSNGTVVLQMALKALNIKKEVISTPFSYVATTNAILWEGCTIKFVDIDRNSFCIDPNLLEASITENTEAILATHVYGFNCNVEVIESLAAKYNLRVIYDGAHAFGSKYKNKSLLAYGDISTCSFHATKLFHTVEGGCIICNDDDLARQLMLYRQFGHVYDDYFSIGLNAKNSEFHAAMGLSVLPHMEYLINSRKRICEWYQEKLSGLAIIMPALNNHEFDWNYSYFPIVLSSEEVVLKVKADLFANGINIRRYFFPSLNELSFLNYQACPVSEDLSRKVICLPLYPDLPEADVIRVCGIIKNGL
jgi:dTDP-4-amino-4,6-dideoxygalactose transaminase